MTSIENSTQRSSQARWRICLVFYAAVWLLVSAVIFASFGKTPFEKFLTSCLMPLAIVWHGLLLGALLAFVYRQARFGWMFLGFAALIWVAGNATLSAALLTHRESQFQVKSPQDFDDSFDAIIVLGGCARRLPGGRAEVTQEGQRIVTAAEFWNAGKVELLVTTGTGDENPQLDSSLFSRDILVGLGVDPERIVQVRARNTYEEINALGEFVRENAERFPNNRIGIITSAFHIPRAMRLAEAKGLQLTPLPSGHRGTRRSWYPTDLLPVSRAMQDNSVLLKEYLAYLVGR